ncbi:MAG: glycosyl transferase [Clostridia bacterium]|nr:glycosyl transferase [Clostridia bacterium]
MIPKIIHYCWFGGNPMPELALKCIESWKEHCGDFELVEWNEDSFDISSKLYVKQAYEAKKYAFVTDYVRLYALYTQGGVYMDTDVFVLKKLDPFLDNHAFSGFESKAKVPTGIMAAEKGSPVIAEFLKYYDTAEFIKADGTYDTTTNVEIITEAMIKKGLCLNGEMQTVSGFTLYPQNIFCPLHKKLEDKDYMKDTVTIHYFAGSWRSEKSRQRSKKLWWHVTATVATSISKVLKKIFGDKWIKLRNKIREKVLSD